LEASGLETLDLRHKRLRVEYDAIANHALRVGLKDSSWDLMEDELLFVDYNRMPSIGTALVSDDDACAVGQHVNDFALAFITPLGTHHHQTPAMLTKHWQSP